MRTKRTKKKLQTVEACEQRTAVLQVRILGRIEKQDWRGARRLSSEIGRCERRKVEIQKAAVRELPLFHPGMKRMIGGGK
jgi:hypothetical protein